MQELLDWSRLVNYIHFSLVSQQHQSTARLPTKSTTRRQNFRTGENSSSRTELENTLRMFFETPKWHEGKSWDQFLKIYDEIARIQFNPDEEGGGESKLIPTSFGNTQVHIRGNPDNPPMVFFHGISSCSLMFGEWLVPRLSKEYYCVVIDTIGDIGRSCPKDKDPTKGPKTGKDVADWAVEVFDNLGLRKSSNENEMRRVNLVGYSFGAFLACCVAQNYPDFVQNIILMAPAGVVSPVRKVWLAQAILFALLSKMIPENSYMAERLQTWFFGSMMADTSSMKNLKYPELRKATDDVGMPQVQVQPEVFDVETLKQMTASNPTLLIIGRHENVTDVTQAIDTATKSNMELVIYDNAGHMFFCEDPRETAIDDIIQFMSKAK